MEDRRGAGVFRRIATGAIIPMAIALISLAGCDDAKPPVDNGDAAGAAEPTGTAAPATIDEAVARGDIDGVRKILSTNPGAANAGARPSSPPLHQAILRKRTEIAHLLIESGADVNAVDSSKRTPLHLCVERDLPDLVAPLRKAGAAPDERDSTGWTPLHHAGAKNRVAVAAALIENGANVNARSERGGTPLHEAAASGSGEIVQLFLDRGVDQTVVASDGVTALDVAVKFENQAAIALLSGTR